MGAVRRHLRALSAAWLLFQALSLSAFVPRDCCAAHRPAADAGESCHQPAPPDCPMRGADGAPCPMHRGHAGHDLSPRDQCALRGACSGPLGAVAAQLANVGILSDTSPSLPVPAAAPFILPAAGLPAGQIVPPDPPPPRA